MRAGVARDASGHMPVSVVVELTCTNTAANMPHRVSLPRMCHSLQGWVCLLGGCKPDLQGGVVSTCAWVA